MKKITFIALLFAVLLTSCQPNKTSGNATIDALTEAGLTPGSIQLDQDGTYTLSYLYADVSGEMYYDIKTVLTKQYNQKPMETDYIGKGSLRQIDTWDFGWSVTTLKEDSARIITLTINAY